MKVDDGFIFIGLVRGCQQFLLIIFREHPPFVFKVSELVKVEILVKFCCKGTDLLRDDRHILFNRRNLA